MTDQAVIDDLRYSLAKHLADHERLEIHSNYGEINLSSADKKAVQNLLCKRVIKQIARLEQAIDDKRSKQT